MKTNKVILLILVLVLGSFSVQAWSLFSPPAPPPTFPLVTTIGSYTKEVQQYLFTGFNATGVDGATNRLITLNNTNLTSNEIIIVDNFILRESADYIIVHANTSTNITFLNNLWNSSNIEVMIMVDIPVKLSLIQEVGPGSFASGVDGSTLRVWTIHNTLLSKNELIMIDNFALIKDIDYNVNHTTSNSKITFLNRIWDSQNVVIKYYQDAP